MNRQGGTLEPDGIDIMTIYWNDKLIALWMKLRAHRKELNRGFDNPDVVSKHLELIDNYRAEVVCCAKMRQERVNK